MSELTEADIERYRNYEEASGVSRDAICDLARRSLQSEAQKLIEERAPRIRFTPEFDRLLQPSVDVGELVERLERVHAPEPWFEDYQAIKQAATRLKQQAEEIERLDRAWHTISNRLSKSEDEWKLWFSRFQEARAKLSEAQSTIEALQRDVERYREALKRVDAADALDGTFSEIARAALRGAT
jgi:septal ring factor EnvC (AmiA/AmiB activator)